MVYDPMTLAGVEINHAQWKQHMASKLINAKKPSVFQRHTKWKWGLEA